MAYTEAQKTASRKYNEKAYDRLEIKVPKGQREIIKQYAQQHGKSVNQFVNEAIAAYIK